MGVLPHSVRLTFGGQSEPLFRHYALPNVQDAEEACRATFLVLMRRANEADVVAGYGRMVQEIGDQLRAMGDERPTRLLVQVGVGGFGGPE